MLIRVFAEAANADPMAGPTVDPSDLNVPHPGAEGNAVVAGGDDGVGDLDGGGVAEVDSVGVGAVAGGGDVEVV